MLPLVQRELRVAARRPSLYRNRLLIGMAVVVLGAGALVFNNPNHPGSGQLFAFFAVIALVACLVEGLHEAADAISEEKRAGTLGFLFLTSLKGWDIILGKFTGAFIRAFNGLLAFIPMLAVTLLMGGTTAGEFWRTVLACCVALFFSLAVCLFISVFTREKSLTAGVFVLLAISFLPMLASRVFAVATGTQEWRWVAAASPVQLLLLGWERFYAGDAAMFWGGAAALVAGGLGLLILSSWILPHVWQERPRKAKVVRTPRRNRIELSRRRRQLDLNPILWIAYNHRQARSFRAIFYTFAAACLGLRIFFMYRGWDGVIPDMIALGILTLLLNVYIASQASMNLAESRRNGSLELVLTTPVKVNDIIHGQVLALKEMFLLPALLLLAGYCWAAASVALYFNSLGPALGAAVPILQYILGICTIAAVGMWMGMTSKTPNRALFKTLFFGMLLPYMFCVPASFVQLILAPIAREQVIRNFRRYVSEKYLQAAGFMLAPPPPADPNVPPVIR